VESLGEEGLLPVVELEYVPAGGADDVEDLLALLG
jgi:hypothetical protein